VVKVQIFSEILEKTCGKVYNFNNKALCGKLSINIDNLECNFK